MLPTESKYARNVLPAPSTKETASYRPQHVSQHVRHARAVTHVGVANLR